MFLWVLVCWLLFCCLPAIQVICGTHLPGTVVPRKTVPYNDDTMTLFRVDDVQNYSSMLLREDLGLLLLGAREAVYALDMRNISHKKTEVQWSVTHDEQVDCTNKGKNSHDCWNYIRVLHALKDGKMYVCGTNAFSPACNFMTYEEGKLSLQNKKEDGKGKCPFDPHQRYASLMVDDVLYSATTMNFLGSEPVLLRSFSTTTLRTEFKATWLNEPRFISMEEVPESQGSTVGDDDKVYLFFNEVAVEYDFYSKLTVSRVARVCKVDVLFGVHREPRARKLLP
ncbi:semaphorin-4E-like [Arapaima gigas]